MTDPLLTTKFHLPSISPKAIYRPHLIEDLNDFILGKLTLVSAPAGFGKTILVSMWAKEKDYPVIWLSLDAEDNDPARFMTYFIAAFQHYDEAIAVGALENLKDIQPASNRSVMTDLLNDLARIEDDLILVLDDYHLIQSQVIHDDMIFLLDHLPKQIHLVIITRADPPFPLPRLRSRGHLAEIRQDTLKFTTKEAAAYLNSTFGLDLSSKDIQALEARTEGWIAGLHMAAISLRGHNLDPISKSAFIRDFSGSHRFVLDYLVEEVLEQLHPQLQLFLLRTSFLNRMCSSLCDYILEDLDDKISPALDMKDSHAILEYLEASNLFIVPMDDQRHWFRYHRLFADLLKQRLLQKTPHILPTLQSRASEWFQENGYLPEAIDHAIAARKYDHAADLIIQVAEKTLMRSELSTLLRWIESLPIDVSSKHPSICIYHAWTQLLSGYSLEAIDGCLETLNLKEAPVDGEVAGLQALLALFQGNMARVGENANIALEKLPEEKVYLRGFAQWLSGLSRLLSGEWNSGHEDLDQLVRISQAAGNMMLAVMVMCNLAEIYIIQGKLYKASTIYQQALDLAVDRIGNPLPIAGEAQIGLGEVYREWNDLKMAELHLSKGILLSRKWSETGIFEGYIYLAYVRYAGGDWDGTRQAVEEAWKLARQFDATELDDRFVSAHEAYFWVMQGNLVAAERWAEEQGLSVDGCRQELKSRLRLSSPVSHRRRTQEHLTFVRLLYCQGRYQEAFSILDLLTEISKRWSLFGRKVKLDILKALILQALGEQKAALDLLEEALSMAETEGFKRVFLDEGEAMVHLLRLAVLKDPNQAYARELLSIFPLTTGSDQDITTRLIDPLSDRELEVLHLLGRGLTNPEIAKELVIAVSTVRSHCKSIYSKLDVHSRWDATQQAKKLGYL